MSSRAARLSPSASIPLTSSTSRSTSPSPSSSSSSSVILRHPLVAVPLALLCLCGFLLVITHTSPIEIVSCSSSFSSSSSCSSPMGGSSSSIIHLRTGDIDAANDKTAVKPAGMWSHSEQKQSVAPTSRDLYLITFTAPIVQEARDRVAELIAPVKLETYIPDNTFLVYITHQQAGAIASAAAENAPSGIVAVIPLAKIHRVQPALMKSLEKQVGNTASLIVLLSSTYPIRTDEEATARAAAIQTALVTCDAHVTVTVMAHDKLKVNTNKHNAVAVADHLSALHDVQWVEAAAVHKVAPSVVSKGPKLTL